MIKSTKSTLTFSNANKLNNLNLFLNEYKRVLSLFIDLLWKQDKISSLLPKEITSQVSTWLSARAIQCAGKQASGIVRGTRTKQEKRLYVIKKFNKEGQYKKARALKAIYDANSISKPIVDNLEAELDSRFIKINLDNKTTFDGWLTLTSLGNKLSIKLPFKKHKHFNKMLENGHLKDGVRLSNLSCTFMFDLPDPIEKTSGSTIGIDIGQKTTLSCSNGKTVETDNHGHTYESICNKLSRKKKGSISFGKAQKHRSNYIRWCVNQVDLDGIKQVNLERIKYLRKGKRTSRSLGHWNYKELFDRLESKFIESGVLINKLNPAYTSQRCSSCGWVRKSNRKLKVFKCDQCGYAADSDLNAATNLSLNLMPIGDKKRLSHSNRLGFYWNEISQEPIVSDAKRA